MDHSLPEIGEKFNSSKLSHGYLNIYENHFKNIRDKVKSILEIGIYDGSTLKVWKEYFPNAKVYGVDSYNFKVYDEERIETFYLEQGNREHLGNILSQIDVGSFDIIIDNGSHMMDHTQISLGYLFNYLNPKGFYVIESLHVCPETKGTPVNSSNYLKSNEITNLQLLEKLSKKSFEDINLTYMTYGELHYLINNYESCNIELGEISEIAFIQKKDKSSKLSMKLDDHLPFLARKYQTDKINHNYIYFYEKYLKPKRKKIQKVLEIGVNHGSSHKMWEEYFPNAMVYGIDIDDKTHYDSKRIKTFIADQANTEELQNFIDEVGSDFDLIIDDGGHTMKQNQISLGFLFKHLKKNGIYVIEDIHTSPDTNGNYYGDTIYGQPCVEGEEISTLGLSVLMANNRFNDIERTFIEFQDLQYIEKNLKYCNVEMGKSSEIVFLGHK